MCSGRVSSSCSTRDTCVVTVKQNEHTHYYNRYTILMHVGDVRLIWMHVDIKIFLPLFGQFSEIIVCIFICLCSLIPTRIWGTHTACFIDNQIHMSSHITEICKRHDITMCGNFSSCLNNIYLLISLLSSHYFHIQLFYFCL
jgi:hypothetical protein